MSHNINGIKSEGQIIQDATDEYLGQLDANNPPDRKTLASELLAHTQNLIELENSVRHKSLTLKMPKGLFPTQIGTCMARLDHICLIPLNGKDEDDDNILLYGYCGSGTREGLYVHSDKAIRQTAMAYNPTLTNREFQEIKAFLHASVPRKMPCTERDLIAVNNGIFDYRNKKLLPFSPDIVFLSKSSVDYVENAPNRIMINKEAHDVWNINTWMREIAGDDEIETLLWEILGAVIRPNVRWNKSAWFYSDIGNNGKGTFCELARNLCGKDSCASVPITDFGKDFLLEPLIGASAIIVDENDVGAYLDKAANLKAVITNDVFTINRKNKTVVPFQFRGFMIQCVNELPRMKDKSESLYRRLLFIPFTQSFTGRERKYIKSDYMRNKEILEYVLWKVLNMDYYELSEPAACKKLLDEYKVYNDPIRAFAEEMLPQCVWDLLPFTFLYDLYKAWYQKYNSCANSILSRQKFVDELLKTLPPEWICENKSRQIYPNQKRKNLNLMGPPEPLIGEYQLTDWRNPFYHGNDHDKICTPRLKDKYRGILRASTVQNVGDIESETE